MWRSSQNGAMCTVLLVESVVGMAVLRCRELVEESNETNPLTLTDIEVRLVPMYGKAKPFGKVTAATLSSRVAPWSWTTPGAVEMSRSAKVFPAPVRSPIGTTSPTPPAVWFTTFQLNVVGLPERTA